jgi:hypothetical protein
MCARVGNQQSRGVVTVRVQTDAIRSLHHQHRDLHQSTYPVPLGRSGLILLLGSSESLPPYIILIAKHICFVLISPLGELTSMVCFMNVMGR